MRLWQRIALPSMRLWQRIALALGVLSLVTVGAFGLWQYRAFSAGFLAYLDASTLQRLQAAAERVAQAYDPEQGWIAFESDPMRLPRLIDDRGVFDRPPPGGSNVPQPDPRPQPPGGPPPRPQGSPPGDEPRGPPGDPRDMLGRVALFDADNRRVAGRDYVPADAPGVALIRDGVQIGTLRLAPLPRADTPVERDFARAQLRTLLIAGAAMLLAALAAGVLLSRTLLAPVQRLAAAARGLAAGEYQLRVPVQGGDELENLARDFNQLAHSLERNRAAARQWSADMAHELRTPIAILRAEVQALRDGIEAPSDSAFASLDAECGRLQSLVEDLYQLSLADAGALEYRLQALDLVELVESVLDGHRRLLANTGLTLETHFERSAWVRADDRRLAQLLNNLLANSARYTDAPGRVRVSVTTQEKDVVLRVEDSAPGVDAQRQGRLFERLYRVDASRSRAAGGAGLGLAIVRSIAEAHGARIETHDSALGGLCIELHLPRSGAEPA